MNKIAIIIFAYSAKAEYKYNRLLSDPLDNFDLFEKLNKYILSLVIETCLPYYIFDETCQTGNFYGECLANAITATYNMGFEKVIVVRNDCPKLNHHHLQQAITQIEKNSVVIGPDHFGGAYLIGISSDVFNRDAFIAFNWDTNVLIYDLKNHYSFKTLLPTLRVLNSRHSLRIESIKGFFAHLMYMIQGSIFHKTGTYKKQLLP